MAKYHDSSTDCNYRTAAALCTLKTWFVSSIYLSVTFINVITRIIIIELNSCLFVWQFLPITPFCYCGRTLCSSLQKNSEPKSMRIWGSQVRASSYDSNKSTNKMQQFHKFITWRSCVAQHVSGRFLAYHQEQTAALEASGFTVGKWRLERCWSWSVRPRPTTLHPPLSIGNTRGP